MENLFTPNCIRTFTGIYMNVFEPTLDMIDIRDIAHALSNQCRFGGHLPRFYSVAEHCIHCFQRVSYKYQLQALLHDASEAYLMDIPSPVKHKLSNYCEIEDNLMKLIALKFHFNYPLQEPVKTIDKQMLQLEWEYMMLQKHLPTDGMFDPWSPEHAERRFLEIYKRLTGFRI